MMFQSIVLLSFLATASAFAPAAKFSMATRISMSDVEPVAEVAEEVVEVAEPVFKFDPKSQPGVTGPLGFFDPLDLSGTYTDDLNVKVFASFAEAERKHGRVAMIAFLGILIGETTGLLFDGKITGPAIYQFQQAEAFSPVFSLGVVWLIAMAEVQTIITAWQPAEETFKDPTGVAGLRADHITGDYGFDPLNIKPKSADALLTMTNKEINNGRLAMLGVAGIVAQELVTNAPIF